MLPSACSFIVDGLTFSFSMFYTTWPHSGVYDVSRQLNLKIYWTIQCSRILKYNIVKIHKFWMWRESNPKTLLLWASYFTVYTMGFMASVINSMFLNRCLYIFFNISILVVIYFVVKSIRTCENSELSFQASLMISNSKRITLSSDKHKLKYLLPSFVIDGK
jgi:hypothetical protein